LVFNNLIENFLLPQAFSLSDKLDNIISLKRKTSFFKKKNKLDSYLLFRTNFIRSNKFVGDSVPFFSKKNSNNLLTQQLDFVNSMEYQLSVQELDSDKLIELKRKTY
jgi:hypothetical protein